MSESEPSSRPAFARYREIMSARGFRPSRKLGQNFLLDASLHRAIADAAGVGADEVVLEVGAGLGFLTRELAARARRVVAVEFDERLAGIVGEELGSWPAGDRVELIRADVLDGDQIHAEVRQAVMRAAGPSPFAIVANLPYAVSGRFLAAALLDPELGFDRVVVVVQRELAERIAAPPGSREYGGLAVLAQARGSAELVRMIGRDVFRPRPNVDSAVLRLVCRRPLPRGFGAFVRTLFQARRKVLRHALKRTHPGCDAPGLSGRWGARRAEDCTAAELLELFAALESADNSSQIPD